MTKQVLTRQPERKPVIRLADGRQLELSRPLVMGVVNVTPDSFSDGGQFADSRTACEHALRLDGEGADIIDIGGESTRPGADPVSLELELERVLPVIEAVRRQTKTPISIDTSKAVVAARALDAGADIVNDVTALRRDPDMATVLKKTAAPVVLMHMLGEPKTMQVQPRYEDCVGEIRRFFEQRISYAETRGIDRSRIILDPGIGFGKRLVDNLDIFARLDELATFGLPLLVGASRKRFIDMLHPTGEPAHTRLGGSIAAAVMAVLNGADIVRVHDVAETVEALKVVQAIRTET
ncbi:MAG: dihydropteroate synthase [candidate division Zixibacteria bacterium]|jgi:dihydropteroate synthase|nr:dihydropteroate synthase [candidate division Zixibacteria bacterium]